MHFSGPRLRLSAFLLPLAVLACDGDEVSGPTGSLQVTSLTLGVDPDLDGYTVMLDGRGVGLIGASGTTLIDDVPLSESLEDLRFRGVPRARFHDWCDSVGATTLKSMPKQWQD